MEATHEENESDQLTPIVSLETLLPDGQPDWEAITFEVNCSRCDYNLRLLPLPRCPECGLQFEWREVIDRAAHRSKFLFEHNWRKQPIRSYFTTILKSLRPFRFWSKVSIYDDIRPGPLWFLLLTSILWFPLTLLIVSLAGWTILEAVCQIINVAPWSISATRDFNELQEYLWVVVQIIFGLESFLFIILGIMLFGFLVAFVILCSLRQTLQRRRVRTVQVLRVMAYSAAPFWIILGILFLSGFALAVIIDNWHLDHRLIIPIISIMHWVSMLAASTIPIVAGLKRYLHLPRPTALGLTAVFLSFFLCSIISVVVSTWF